MRQEPYCLWAVTERFPADEALGWDEMGKLGWDLGQVYSQWAERMFVSL